MPAEPVVPETPLSFRVEVQDSATVVYCKGRWMAGETGELRNAVKALFPSAKRIVLDLTELTRMDSMGLGALVSLYVSAKAAGCELRMVNFGERVRQLLIVTNLLDVFEEYGKHIVKMP
jgi:anti-anti-sigma factor